MGQYFLSMRMVNKRVGFGPRAGAIRYKILSSPFQVLADLRTARVCMDSAVVLGVAL